MIWDWGKFALALVHLAQWAADRAERDQMLGLGIKAQIADSLMAFNRRMHLGLQISRELRSADDALDELRKSGI
ncbi:MAG: hypothetical protein SGJ07_15160 [Rhodospirillaceae bacterium]|nr:hypothetical protein [Rhodospirillaceae bacterium]